MKRFDFNEEEFQDNPEEDTTEADLINHAHALDFMQIELAKNDLNQRILFKTIKFLEKSWFWRFRRTNSKMKKIIETYLIFKRLFDITEASDGNV